jgi:hypothetical protein
MKKLVLTIGCAMAVSGAVYAQGTINSIAPGGNFTSQTNTTTYSFIQGGGAVVGGSQAAGNAASAVGFYYELLYSTTPFNGSSIAQPNSTSALFGGTWQDVGLTYTNQSGTTGRIQPTAPNASYNEPAGMGAGGVGVGQTNYLVLVGWSANLGTSWSVVSNELATGSYATVLGSGIGFFGESATGYLVGNTGNPGVNPFGTVAGANGLPIIGTANQLYELSGTAVPEPSTMALAGLGGLSMLLFRRKK